MKLVIYIVLFVLLLFYIYKHSQYIKEKLSNISYYQDTTQFDVLNTEKVVPIQQDNKPNVQPFDTNENYWVVKPDFSDIFNTQDEGSKEINDIINLKEESNFLNFYLGNRIEKAPEMEKLYNQTEKTKKLDFPLEYDYENNRYKLIGTASNPYFNQHYLLYELEIKSSKTNLFMREELKYNSYKIYQYLLVQIQNGKPVVIYAIGPRAKVNPNDIVYFAMGNFQVGPLTIHREIKKEVMN
jgi:hypothetical protein